MASLRNYFLPGWRGLFDNTRQNNIDLLRAIAVVSVFIHHAQVTFGGNFPFFGEYGGQFGPQMFFVISGYLIAASSLKHAARDYVLHRFFRIMPAYLFFFLGIGIFNGVITTQKVGDHPGQFLANLSLMQQLFPAALLQFDVMHVTWTLTVEVLWYALAPLLLLRRRLLSTSTTLAITAISTVWVVLANNHFLDGLYPGITDTNPGWSYLFLANHFLAQMCFFAFGAWIYCHQKRFKNLNPLIFLICAIFIFILRPYYFIFNPIFITGIGIGLLLIGCLYSHPIKNRVAFWISETSYSIYLCHFPIILWVHGSWQLQGLAGVAVAVTLTLTISTLSYLLIEKPAVRLGRRLSSTEKIPRKAFAP